MRHLFILLILFCNLFVSGQEIERGIGVIYLNESLPTKNTPKTDTMLIYSDKNLLSIVSKYVFIPNDRFENKLITNAKYSSKAFFEFDYETMGLPIASIDITNSMIEVIYAYNNNIPLKGWVKCSNKSIGYHQWKYHLLMKYLYFLSDEFKFYKSPNGETIEIQITKTGNGLDYIMKPIKIADNWMLVKVVSPSDFCDDPEKKIEVTCWIKYLSETGRPLVWYYTRGC